MRPDHRRHHAGTPPRAIAYRSDDARRASQALSASDLMAQMADRHYLEKVLLLYQEFEDARLPGFSSELDLLRQTESFYHHQAKIRLSQELGDMGRFLSVHFQTRWGVDRDLYQEATPATWTTWAASWKNARAPTGIICGGAESWRTCSTAARQNETALKPGPSSPGRLPPPSANLGPGGRHFWLGVATTPAYSFIMTMIPPLGKPYYHGG